MKRRAVSVPVRQHRCYLIRALYAAVESEVQVRKIALECIDPGVAQRRHGSVLMRRKSVKEALSRMHDEVARLRARSYDTDKASKCGVGVDIVHADAALDRHRRCVA